MCQENFLYQVDLLNPAKVRITDREYWAQKRGQAKLDKENAEKAANGDLVTETKYETDKAFLRSVISDTIFDSNSYDDFCKKLFEKYGISVHENRGRISYLLPDRNRPIRGRHLGTDYEKESIEKALLQRSLPVGSGIRFVTDLENNIKARQNAYYLQKAKVGNLQQMAKALVFVQDNGIQSLEKLDQLDAAVSDDFTKINKSLKDTESLLRKVNLMIKNTGQYLANKEVYKQHLAAKNKTAFRETHRAELSLYEAARKYLQEESGGDKLPTMKMLKEEKAKLTALKNRQYEEYSITKAKHRELQAITHNVHMAMGISPEQSKERNTAQKKKEQSI